MPCNMVKSGLTWSRVFRRRHLGRLVTAVTRLRLPTVIIEYGGKKTGEAYQLNIPGYQNAWEYANWTPVVGMMMKYMTQL